MKKLKSNLARNKTFSNDMISILSSRSSSSDLKRSKRTEPISNLDIREEKQQEKKSEKERNRYRSDLQEAIDGEIEKGVAHVDDDVDLGGG